MLDQTNRGDAITAIEYLITEHLTKTFPDVFSPTDLVPLGSLAEDVMGWVGDSLLGGEIDIEDLLDNQVWS